MSDQGKELTSKQAAEYLGVSPVTIRQWVNRGKLQGRLLDPRRRLFTVEELEKFKAQRAAAQVTKS